MVWILIVFFIFVTLLFLVFAIFLPELVGITGKKARDIMEEHQQEKSPSDEPETSSSQKT